MVLHCMYWNDLLGSAARPNAIAAIVIIVLGNIADPVLSVLVSLILQQRAPSY